MEGEPVSGVLAWRSEPNPSLPPIGRPNTVPPALLTTISSEELASLTVDELIDLASDKFGLVFPRGTRKGKVLQAIIDSAIAISDS